MSRYGRRQLTVLPEGTIGRMAVVTRYHPRLPYYGRHIRYTGNMLVEGDTVWMSDGPEERLTMSAAARWCPSGGDVLVGGLGLGIFPRWVHSRVLSMTIVENSRDVIHLVYDHVRTNNMTIVHADIDDYLRTTNDTFDYAFLDTWPDTRPARLPTIMYLKALASARLRRPGDRVVCWGERRMRAELTSCLYDLARAYERCSDEALAGLCGQDNHNECPGAAQLAEWLGRERVPLSWPRVKRRVGAIVREYACSELGGSVA